MMDAGYLEYLKSDKWKVIAQCVKAEAGYRCRVCYKAEDLRVHHRTYDNIYHEEEHLSDLTCLCDKRHTLFHLKKKTEKKQYVIKAIGGGMAKARRYGTQVVEVKPKVPKIPKNSVISAVSEDGVPQIDSFPLTRELIEKCMTDRGGYTKATREGLGSFDRKEDIFGLVGKEITRAGFIKAMYDKNTFVQT